MSHTQALVNGCQLAGLLPGLNILGMRSSTFCREAFAQCQEGLLTEWEDKIQLPAASQELQAHIVSADNVIITMLSHCGDQWAEGLDATMPVISLSITGDLCFL